MILLNYTITDNIVPTEIYEYTDNERYLLLLFGNVVIQTIKKTSSLNDGCNETINPVIKQLVDKYSYIIREKENQINELEQSKKLTTEIYKDLIETEKTKIDIEIQREISKEKKHFDETLKLFKDNYEQVIFSLKKEKENIQYQLEQFNNCEKENAVMDEKIKNYDSIIEYQTKNTYNETYINFQKEKEVLKEEIISLKTEIQKIMNEKEIEKFELLKESHKKNEIAIVELQNKIEEIKQQNSKKSVSQNIGQEGELYFFQLAKDVFDEIDDFEIEDTTKKGHAGDFILKFKEFSVIVDVKNFNNSKVGVTDIRKLKSDAKSNQHIRFVWMVSLNRSISTHDKYAIDFEYENGVLFCYINSLFHWKEQQKNILIACWLFCKELYLNFFDKENENTEKIITLLRRDNNKKLVAERGRKKIKELRSVLEQIKSMIYELEKDFIEIMSNNENGDDFEQKDILVTYQDNIVYLKKWWISMLVREEGNKNKLDLESIFNRFISSINENDVSFKIDMDNFILFLKTIVKKEDLSKNKTKNSKKYLLNYKWIN